MTFLLNQGYVIHLTSFTWGGGVMYTRLFFIGELFYAFLAQLKLRVRHRQGQRVHRDGWIQGICCNGASFRALTWVVTCLAAVVLVGMSFPWLTWCPFLVVQLLGVDQIAAWTCPWRELNELGVGNAFTYLADDVIDVYLRTVNELVFRTWQDESWLNHLIHMVPQLLVHCEVLHSGSLIDQVDVRLLLFLGIIIHVWLCLERHPISLSLELLVNVLKWWALWAQVDPTIVLILLTQSLGWAGLVGHQLLTAIHTSLFQVYLSLDDVMDVSLFGAVNHILRHSQVLQFGRRHASLLVISTLVTPRASDIDFTLLNWKIIKVTWDIPSNGWQKILDILGLRASLLIFEEISAREIVWI